MGVWGRFEVFEDESSFIESGADWVISVVGRDDIPSRGGSSCASGDEVSGCSGCC